VMIAGFIFYFLFQLIWHFAGIGKI
jgi:hypothetical protein